MTSPHLLFESTSHFPQSEIQPVFRFLGKYLVTPNLYAFISPRGEKSGLVLAMPDQFSVPEYLLDPVQRDTMQHTFPVEQFEGEMIGGIEE